MIYRLYHRAATLAALLLCGVALAVGAAEVAGVAGAAPDFGKARKAADGSLVRVRATLAIGADLAQAPATFTNTGFLVSPDGYVLTSLLAVAGSSQVRVVLPDSSVADAHLVAVDQAAGLALLKCDLTDATPMQFAVAAPVVGQWVAVSYAVPDEADAPHAPALELARVAALEGAVRLNGYRWSGLICAPAHVGSGSAAAPLLDAEGRVVGVLLAARCDRPFTSFKQACEVYGLPAGHVQRILEKMRQGESRRLGWLGVAVAQESGDREGARVAAVLEASPAHVAGIRPGDVLLEINGTPIEQPVAVAEMVAEAGPQSGMRIKLLRGNGQIIQIAADLQPRPLAICTAPLRPGAEPPLSLPEVVEQNRQLRARIAELEAARLQLEQRVRQLEAAQGQ
jgi:S1-C subfamily serine protease